MSFPSQRRIPRRGGLWVVLAVWAGTGCAAPRSGTAEGRPPDRPARTTGKLELKAGTARPQASLALGQLTLGKGGDPACDPKSVVQISFEELDKNGISDLATLGVVVAPTDKTVTLHKMTLKAYRGEKVAWQSEVDCTGCSQPYAVKQPGSGLVSGYLFVPDRAAVEALAAARKDGADRVGVAASGHDGGTLQIQFVGLAGS